MTVPASAHLGGWGVPTWAGSGGGGGQAVLSKPVCVTLLLVSERLCSGMPLCSSHMCPVLPCCACRWQFACIPCHARARHSTGAAAVAAVNQQAPCMHHMLLTECFSLRRACTTAVVKMLLLIPKWIDSIDGMAVPVECCTTLHHIGMHPTAVVANKREPLVSVWCPRGTLS